MTVPGRIVAVGLVAASAWLTFTCFDSYLWCKRRIRALHQAVPMRVAVDLSRPGTYSGTYTQICVPPADAYLYVEPSSDVDQISADSSLLTGLAGKMTILDTLGHTLYELSLDAAFGYPEVFPPSGQRLLAFRMRDPSFPVGSYTVELEVEKGAAALSSVPHTLVAKYDVSLYPILSMYLFVLTGFALAAMVTVILIVVGVARSGRARLRRQQRMAGCCPQCGYDLHGLPEPRCPECGAPLDPASLPADEETQPDRGPAR